MIQKLFATLALTLILVPGNITPATAQNLDVIKERKDSFQALLPHAKVGKAMVQGRSDFDLEKAKGVFQGYAALAKKLPTLFPEDSKEGGKTEALPVIWEKKDDFKALFAKFEKDAETAAESITDAASFRAEWGKVMGNCGTCHKQYRKAKS
ncbi:MAG: cytochrome c [Pseudomonadota bacterium]